MTKAIDPAKLRKRARLGGLARSAMYDGREVTAAATAAQLDRFIREVDPELKLPEAERLRRATAAQRLYMVRLAYRSVEVRAANRASVDGKVSAGQPVCPPEGR